MKKYLMEFIGTFFLVLAICMTVIGGAGNFAPIAIGSMLMVMIFAGGHISGAHYNPAVTLGVFLRGKCLASDVPMYMIAQCLGAVAAHFVSCILLASLGAEPATASTLSVVPALIAEFLGTFALVFVILNVATADETEGNSFYGLAIGFTVTACAYALGGVSGGAFNPAVALGVTFAGLSAWANIWIFIVANLAAGAAAAAVFKITHE